MITHFFQILSRSKPALQANKPTKSDDVLKHSDHLEDYIRKRDYTGAITFLEVNK